LHEILSSVRSKALVAQRRAEIAGAALGLFRNKGFKSTSVEEVATQLRIDKATLYGYISKKEDLLYLVFQHYVPAYTTRLETAASSFEDPLARLDALIVEQIRIIDESPEFVLLTYRELRHLHHEAVGSVLEMIRANHAPFERAIQDGIDAGLLVPIEPAIATHALLSMLHMWAAQFWDLERFGVESVSQAARRIFFKGVARDG